MGRPLKSMCNTALVCPYIKCCYFLGCKCKQSTLPLKLSLLHSIVFHMLLRACETRSQCVSLAPLRTPLKPSLLHVISCKAEMSISLGCACNISGHIEDYCGIPEHPVRISCVRPRDIFLLWVLHTEF